MNVPIENLIADFNSAVIEVRNTSLICIHDQRAVQRTHQELREETYENRVRSSATDLPELERVVQRQQAARCLHLSATMAFKESNRRVQKAHDRFKALLNDLVGTANILSDEQSAKILQDVFYLRKHLSWFKDRSKATFEVVNQNRSWASDIDAVFRRVDGSEFAGFTSSCSELVSLTPIFDAARPEILNSRIALAIREIQKLVHPELFDTDDEALNPQVDSLLFPSFPGHLRRVPVYVLLNRYQAQPRYPIQDVDILASALLAGDKEKVNELNLRIGIRDAHKELIRADLVKVLKPLREAVYELRNLLLEARELLSRGLNTHVQLNCICGSLVLREVRDLLAAKVDSVSSETSPLRNALALLAAEETSRKFGQ